MSDIVIVKNNTGTSVFIEDMGTPVPGSGQRTFSDLFDFTEICVSEDLKIFINNSTFTINDGTSDLSIANAITYLECKGESGSGVSFEDIRALTYGQSVESVTLSATTSTTYLTKLSITIPTTNPIGDFILIGTADFQSLNNNKQVGVRLYNITEGIQYNESIQQTNNNTNWFSYVCQKKINFTGAAPVTVGIQYKNVGGTTCRIRQCIMSLWRIG